MSCSISPPQAENFAVFRTRLRGFPLVFLRKSLSKSTFIRYHVPKNFRFLGMSTFLRFHKPKDFQKSFDLNEKTLGSVFIGGLSQGGIFAIFSAPSAPFSIKSQNPRIKIPPWPSESPNPGGNPPPAGGRVKTLMLPRLVLPRIP